MNHDVRMFPVESSNIGAIGYCEDQRILFVNFLNGYSYRYFDVPVEIFGKLMAADSHGKFLSKYIAYAFEYERLDQPEVA